jgi:hypothetical protein
MQFRSWARGEGELYSRKAARGRDARSGTGNDFTRKVVARKPVSGLGSLVPLGKARCKAVAKGKLFSSPPPLKLWPG